MDTKLLYTDYIWEAISKHPMYNLGRRELAALIRFLPIVAVHASQAPDVLHLASSTGREVPAIVSAMTDIQNYLLNDIVPEVVVRSFQELQAQFPSIKFAPSMADIELSGAVVKLRQQLSNQVLIVLTANGVIFSNRQMDSNIRGAMEKSDLLLLTMEESHHRMLNSYLIPPVFDLLSRSGKVVNDKTVRIWHNNKTGTLHMACGGEDLLVSYKPTPDQLRQRMTNAGFVEVAGERYPDLHMLAGLYRRK